MLHQKLSTLGHERRNRVESEVLSIDNEHMKAVAGKDIIPSAKTLIASIKINIKTFQQITEKNSNSSGSPSKIAEMKEKVMQSILDSLRVLEPSFKDTRGDNSLTGVVRCLKRVVGHIKEISLLRLV